MVGKAIHEIDLWTGNDEVVVGEGIVGVWITYGLEFLKTANSTIGIGWHEMTITNNIPLGRRHTCNHQPDRTRMAAR